MNTNTDHNIEVMSVSVHYADNGGFYYQVYEAGELLHDSRLDDEYFLYRNSAYLEAVQMVLGIIARL